ncbi:MAG: DivIVA domain-containing protein [Deltaproteobacteria bacterium]|nr:DivIVA domain-containing protein [Deltaproteobacteria bacterium]
MEHKNLESLSEKISPTEIKNKEFKKVMLGYSPEEVVEFLDLTAKAWIQVQKKEKELIQKNDSLNAEISHWRQRESEISQIKEDAIKEAETIIQAASQEAETLFKQVEEKAQDIRQKTEEWLAEVINQVEETERRKNSFISAFKSALDSHYEIIKNDQQASEPLSRRLDTFLKSVMQSSSTH